MRGQFMFNRDKKTLLILAVLALLLNPTTLFAEEAGALSVGADALPINATQSESKEAISAVKPANTLVSPSKPSETKKIDASPSESIGASVSEKKNIDTHEVKQPADKVAPAPVATDVKPSVPVAPVTQDSVDAKNQATDDFDFDLKMKAITAPTAPANVPAQVNPDTEKADKPILTDEDLPKAIQYKTNPIDNLGNNILSQMDDDLFSQMSEIEKSTTLLTLELRREKIRNEIEAQKAIRQKAFNDLERQKAEAKLKELEKKKQIEAQVLQEKQTLLDKQQLLEVLKQRKLLNAYMNYMLINQQEWLKEKEALYNKLATVELEKKELTDLFKKKIEKLVDASAKNMQAAEAAKANFDRVVKSLKARNEQLRKRIEADARIIKNAQNSLYLKSQSIEELQSKNAEMAENVGTASTVSTPDPVDEEEDIVAETVASPIKLSAQFAILGITGRADTMSVEVIDANGQPILLKVGSSLPTGHVLKEIGSDYAMFTRDGAEEYLYVGRTIDGIIPTLGLVTGKKGK